MLIVDDVRDITEMLGELVTMLGHEARAATHGERALAIARDFQPDLVLLDLRMPEPDGFEIARRLRALLGSAIELVAMSGWGHAHARQEALDAGFDRHIIKPLTVSHLRSLLKLPARAPQ